MYPYVRVVMPGLEELGNGFRTSNLRAPKVRLEDHGDEVLSCDFHRNGELLLSAGRDRLIRIARVYENSDIVLTMSGHRGPVTQAKFSPSGSYLLSSSGDRTVGRWDPHIGQRINKFEGHRDYVNSVHSSKSENMICSGSDDGTVRVWDHRTKICLLTMKANYRVFATCFTESETFIVCAGADNIIDMWDIRMNRIASELRGHSAAITGIDLSPCGTFLLSHSLDGTLSIWRIGTPKRYGERVYMFEINQDVSQRNLVRCAWSKIGMKVASASSDHEEVTVWNLRNRLLECRLPVHDDCVNDIVFHPFEPILLTASSDTHLCLSEINY